MCRESGDQLGPESPMLQQRTSASVWALRPVRSAAIKAYGPYVPLASRQASLRPLGDHVSSPPARSATFRPSWPSACTRWMAASPFGPGSKTVIAIWPPPDCRARIAGASEPRAASPTTAAAAARILPLVVIGRFMVAVGRLSHGGTARRGSPADRLGGHGQSGAVDRPVVEA